MAQIERIQSGELLTVRVELCSGLKNGKDANNTINKRRLWMRDPHCHWCGVLTRLPLPGEENCSAHDAATLDHVIPKLQRQRISDRDKVVLACHMCNQQRDAVDRLKWRREQESGYGRVRRIDPERRANTLRLLIQLQRGGMAYGLTTERMDADTQIEIGDLGNKAESETQVQTWSARLVSVLRESAVATTNAFRRVLRRPTNTENC